MTVELRRARKIRVHCPIARHTFAELLNGNLGAIESDPIAAAMLAVIRGANPLGDFDLYQGVFELTFGLEGFTATERAQPTAGERSASTLSPTVVITTYVDAAAEPTAVLAALEEMLRAHPWETPVIEFSDPVIQLVRRLPSTP